MSTAAVKNLDKTRSWDALKAAGITRLRCGRHSSRKTPGVEMGCALPQGHTGAHEFTVAPQDIAPGRKRWLR